MRVNVCFEQFISKFVRWRVDSSSLSLRFFIFSIVRLFVYAFLYLAPQVTLTIEVFHFINGIWWCLLSQLVHSFIEVQLLFTTCWRIQITVNHFFSLTCIYKIRTQTMTTHAAEWRYISFAPQFYICIYVYMYVGM